MTSTYVKAITATIAAFLGGVKVAITDGHVTGSEWVDIAYATVLAGGAVWAFPNGRKAPKPGPRHEGVR